MRVLYFVLLLIAASCAQATAIYTYTGNPYTSISNSGLDQNTGELIPTSEPFDNSMFLTVELVFEKELTAGQKILVDWGGYTGEMYNTDNSLVSYSFFDGIDTITGTPGDSYHYWDLTNFVLDVNASGEIEFWALSVGSPESQSGYFYQYMSTGFGPETYPFNSLSTVHIGDNTQKWENGPGRSAETAWGGDLESPQGTWSSSVVPLPPAVWLFGSALAGLGWLRRRIAP